MMVSRANRKKRVMIKHKNETAARFSRLYYCVCSSVTTNEKRENVLEKRIYSLTNRRKERGMRKRKGKRERESEKETSRFWYGDAC